MEAILLLLVILLALLLGITMLRGKPLKLHALIETALLFGVLGVLLLLAVEVLQRYGLLS